MVSGVATLDTQRRVQLAYGNEAVARTMLITGTNGAGATISETLAVPSGAPGTVATLQDFLTVTQAMPAGGGWTAAVTLGTNAVGSTPWINTDTYNGPMQIGFELELLVAGGTATIETTQNSPWPNQAPIYTAGFDQTLPVPTPFAAAGLTGVAGNTQGAVALTTIIAWRLTVTGTGSWRATGIASGLIQG